MLIFNSPLPILQSRRAELELELHRGRVRDEEEYELQLKSAWLWARDKLHDLIKSASKGSPQVQVNIEQSNKITD